MLKKILQILAGVFFVIFILHFLGIIQFYDYFRFLARNKYIHYYHKENIRISYTNNISRDDVKKIEMVFRKKTGNQRNRLRVDQHNDKIIILDYIRKRADGYDRSNIMLYSDICRILGESFFQGKSVEIQLIQYPDYLTQKITYPSKKELFPRNLKSRLYQNKPKRKQEFSVEERKQLMSLSFQKSSQKDGDQPLWVLSDVINQNIINLLEGSTSEVSSKAVSLINDYPEMKFFFNQFEVFEFCNKLSVLFRRTPCYQFYSRGKKQATPYVICDFNADGFRVPLVKELLQSYNFKDFTVSKAKKEILENYNNSIRLLSFDFNLFGFTMENYKIPVSRGAVEKRENNQWISPQFIGEKVTGKTDEIQLKIISNESLKSGGFNLWEPGRRVKRYAHLKLVTSKPLVLEACDPLLEADYYFSQENYSEALFFYQKVLQEHGGDLEIQKISKWCTNIVRKTEIHCKASIPDVNLFLVEEIFHGRNKRYYLMKIPGEGFPLKRFYRGFRNLYVYGNKQGYQSELVLLSDINDEPPKNIELNLKKD